MTQLPATIVEHEALAYAKSRVIFFRDSPSPWLDLPGSSLLPETGDAFMQQLLKQEALRHPTRMMQIIAAAQAGWEHAKLAMLELANEYIHRHELPPVPLANYLMERNAGLHKLPARKKVSNFPRNLIITSIVYELCERFGLKPTRRSSRHPSGCSIMAEALRCELPREVIKPNEKAVEAIWNELRLAMPASPFRGNLGSLF